MKPDRPSSSATVQAQVQADAQLIRRLGGPASLARRLGVQPYRVQNWLKRGVPARVKLDRPDVFQAGQAVEGHAE